MARILVISQSKDEGRSLARLMRHDGHAATMARTELSAKQWLATHHAELIVLAVPDPASLMRRLSQDLIGGARSTPAIAVIHEHERQDIDVDVPGLLDLLSMPFSDDSFLAHIDALLRVRRVLHGKPDAQALEGHELAGRSMGRIGGMILSVKAFLEEMRPGHALRKERPLEPYLETAASLVGTVEGRDGIDPGHAARVAAHCASIAKLFGMRDDETQLLLYAASMHDIGKIAISPALLAKPSLTDQDRKVMRFHPRRGAELIRALTPYSDAADIVLYHHERPDGMGYYRRKPDDVPALARVLAVSDVFDGMTASRHGAAMAPEQAIEALQAGRGVSYDAACVDALAVAARPARKSVPVSATHPELKGH